MIEEEQPKSSTDKISEKFNESPNEINHGPKPKKPMSAYFHYMIEKSKEAKYSKKEIGELWGLLDTSLRQTYIKMAENEKKNYLEWMRRDEQQKKDRQSKMLQDPIVEEGHEGDNMMVQENLNKADDINLAQDESDNYESLIPGHRVKNIQKSDEESSKNLRANTQKYYTQCAELFAKFQVEKSSQDAKSKKKKKIGLSNLVEVLQKDYRTEFQITSNIFDSDQLNRDKRVSQPSKETGLNRSGNKYTKNNAVINENMIRELVS